MLSTSAKSDGPSPPYHAAITTAVMNRPNAAPPSTWPKDPTTSAASTMSAIAAP